MNSIQNSTHFFAYDGNGNVSALVNASNGEVSANYEYGPFGEPIRVSGIMSRENPFRFSTKRIVDSIDIILYEYRAYKPSTGTWLTRDPIGEAGFRLISRKHSRTLINSMNLYAFVKNNAINVLDVIGLYDYEWESNFTEAEKQAIINSIIRVRRRSILLIDQIDNKINEINELNRRCPCDDYKNIAKKLEGVKKVFQGMVKDIDGPSFNLEVYKKDLPPGNAATYLDHSVPWYDDELTLDLSWFEKIT